MSSKKENIIAGVMLAGSLSAVALAYFTWPASDTTITTPKPDPAITAVTPEDSKPAYHDPVVVAPSATQHFNSGKEFVVVCTQDMSRNRQSQLSAQDKEKVKQYKADMVKVAEDLVSHPSEQLSKMFADHNAVVFKIIAWDKSMTQAGVDKIDLMPHKTLAGQACPKDSSPATKFSVP